MPIEDGKIDSFFRRIKQEWIDLSLKSQFLVLVLFISWIGALLSPFLRWFNFMNPPVEPVWRSLIFIVLGLIVVITTIRSILKSQHDISSSNTNDLNRMKDEVISIRRNIEQINESFSSVDEWVKNISIWSNEVQKPLKLNLSNMQDFFIHAPLFVSKHLGYFQKELLEIEIHNARSDINAIEAIKNGEGIAITDPVFLCEIGEQSEYVILAPLVIRPAIWVLKRKASIVDGATENKIFIYDKKSTAYLICENYFKQNYEMAENILNANNIEDLEDFLSYFQSNKDFMMSLEQVFRNGELEAFHNGSFLEKFLLLISLMNTTGNERNKKILREMIINKVKEFNYMFLSEPETTLHKTYFNDIFEHPVDANILIPDEHDDKLKDKLLFTAIITTKKFLRNNPVASVKFLKSLKTGILKTHSTDVENIIHFAIEEIFHKEGKERINNAVNKTFGDINTRFSPKLFYPEDLYLFINKTGLNRINGAEEHYLKILRNTFSVFHELHGINVEKFMLSDEEIENDLKLKFIFDRVNYNDTTRN